MNWVKVMMGSVVLLFATIALTLPSSPPAPATVSVVNYVQHQQKAFASTALILQSKIKALDPKNPQSLQQAKLALRNCRIEYKHLSFFLEYFFTSEAYVFNSPPKYEIDEPFIEYEQPIGMQQMEALLYGDSVYFHKNDLAEEAEVVATSASGIPGLLYNFTASDAQLLESTRIELVRVMALYITGYDAPELKSGLAESIAALNSIDSVYAAYESDSTHFYTQRAVKYLQVSKSFDAFDRLTFLTEYAMPLQRQLRMFAQARGFELNTTAALNGNADNLFSADALRLQAFPGGATTADSSLVKLGRKLFFDRSLSGHQDRSCATCHDPKRYFTDGQEKNSSLQGGLLPRNTPTLLYSGYQYSQFWDGRVKSLEEQVSVVMHNPREMDAIDDSVLHRLKAKQVLQKNDDLHVLSNALAAYIRTLRPFNSPFDDYVAGNKKALTKQQQFGFNVFMGKAQCGTCHFAPVFNGLTPPLYNKTEFEVLGTPRYSDLLHPKPDADAGRYDFFKINFYDGAFKTPTVRNAAMTGPYLHHGAFKTLEQVVDFYDRGGGNGIGLKRDNQTLSDKQLHLTAPEKKALVEFMQGLTDKLPAAN